MDSNTIPVGANTTVVVKASGDLFLEGQDPSEVRFQSSEDRIRIHQSDDTLYVETHASLGLAVPHGLSVVVEKVGGSALVQDVDGSLVVQKVGGDLAMQRLGKVRVEKVGGNCLVSGVTEGLSIGRVGGDLTIREALSAVEIGSIGGDGDLQVGSIESMDARSGGDMRLAVTEAIAGPVMLRAGGDVQVYLPSNAIASFVLSSNGEMISLELTRQAEQVQDTFETRRYEFTLGEGGPKIEVQAGGDIRVSDEIYEPEPLRGEFERRENAWKDARDRRGGSSWSNGFTFDRSSAWAEMVSRRAQEAARRAEQRAQAATRRTEDHIRQAADREMRRAEHWANFGGFPPVPPAPPTPPPPPVEKVTEQERLMVLKMLQENKITIEQAENLLAALEGRINR